MLIFLASVFGLIAVAAGAFGSHGLKGRLSPEMLDVFEIAVRYQMYHALAQFAAAWVAQHSGQSAAVWSGWLFAAGIVIFSGSLYILSLTGVRWLGAVTPLGGLAFLAGWGCLAWAAWKSAK